jgi:hypothetical protein
MLKKDWGNHVLGVSALLFGAISLVWHELTPGEQRLFGSVSLYEVALYVMAIANLAGGLFIQIPRTMRLGAVLIGGVVGIFILLQMPATVANPKTSWIDLFERLGIFSGALILFARTAARPNAQLLQAATALFGVCVISYALAQIVYFQYTASLVPSWIPPGQTFWAGLTTVAFVLAAVAILTGLYRLLAAQLLAIMLLIFAAVVWLPIIVAHPSSASDWSEFTETIAIASGAWILADWLRSRALNALSERLAAG